MNEQTALITGASGGIGYEFAKLLAKDCSMLVLVARNQDRLNAVKRELESTTSARVKVISRNLATANAAEEIFRELEGEKIDVDILINNAGFGDHGAFVGTEWRRTEEMIAVNITALTQLTKLFLPGMLDRKKGRIVNVASTAAFQPGPFMAVYYASKAYVLSFSEALANEMKGTGVTVTALCPGPTATGFATAARMERSRLFTYAKVASAREVAQCGYTAMMNDRTVAVQGFLNRVTVFSVRFAPRKLLPSIVRWLHGNC